MRAVFFLAIAASAHGAAMELTAANFDTEVFNSGKSGFVRALSWGDVDIWACSEPRF